MADDVSSDDSALMSVDPAQLVANVGQVVPPQPISSPAAPATIAPAPANPQQLVANVGQVVPPIVKSSTTTVQGRSKAGVAAQIGADQTSLDQYKTTVEGNAEKADARQQSALDTQIDTKANQRVDLLLEQQHQQDIQKQTNDEVARLQDLPDGKIDPQRFADSLGTGGKIGMTVLAMISGFGSALAGQAGNNPFIPMLQRRIDADIEAQKDELAQGRIRKSNLIARALQKGADAKQAEATARGQLWQLAGQIGDLQAQKLGLQGTQAAQAQNAIAGMQYQADQHFGDLRAQTEAKVQTTREQETGKANGAGQLAELLHKAGELKAQGWTDGQIRAAGLPVPAGQSEQERKDATRTDEQGKVQGAISGVQQFASAVKIPQDTTTGKFVVPAGKSPDDSLPDEGAWSWDPRFWRWGDKPIAHAKARAAAGLAMAGVKNSDDVLTATTYGELTDALNAAASFVAPRQNQRDSGAPIDASALGGKRVQ